MRYIFAIVSLVLAVVLIGYGVAQRTVLAGPDSLVVTAEATSDATVTVIDGETLNSLEGRQDLELSGSDTIFAAFGRTDDVLAWVGDASYNEIGFDDETQSLTSEEVPGSEVTVPNPAGSDLWLREYTGDIALSMQVSLSEDLSIIVVSDGTQPAPSTVTVSWPLDNRTPWAAPLIAAGGAMLLLSFFFFVWAFVHSHRTRGPRRRSITSGQRRTGRTEPGAIGSRGRRSISRMTAVVPIVLVGTLGLSSCASDSWPDLTMASAESSPSASPSAEPEETSIPAVTTGQVESIIGKVSEVAETAEGGLDEVMLGYRFTGPALEQRIGNFAIREKDPAHPALPAFPSGPVAVSVPQSLPVDSDPWPRAIFAVVESPDPATVAPWSVMLVQQSPREQYKVYYAVTLEPNATLPELAPRGVGAPRLSPDTKLLSMAPGNVLANYKDVVTTGDASVNAPAFDLESDNLLPQIDPAARDEQINALKEANGTLEYSYGVGDAETIALASNESGALVTTYLTETTTARPSIEGDTINPTGLVKTLTGSEGSTRGYTAEYSYQLLFYIPPIGSTDKTVLLGFSEALLSAQEIP
ncbi:hypothetical protein [Marisediminicola senii]|uniref:hypothetical protein n=1 Tax=Marisediminicola senii TaxID=2711233 RepID=UPI0013EA96D7|nr:hypothetical protein [Marisediminicola senii]